MSHPSETAGKDFTALALVVVIWVCPLVVVQEGYDRPAVGAFFLAACAAVCWIMHLHPRCGEIARPVITVTVYAVAFGSVMACIAAVFLAIPAIVTIAGSGGLFWEGGDGGTLWLIYLIPAALLIFPITRFMS